MGNKLDVIDVNERSNQQRELTMEEKRRRRQRQRARQLAIKRRRRKRFFQMMALGAASVIVLVIAGRLLFPEKKAGNAEENTDAVETLADNKEADSIGVVDFLYEIKYEEFFKANKPQQFSDREVYEWLAELAAEYSELEEIYERRNEYPMKLLVALCNNPEMHEYVKDYLTYVSGDTSVAGESELTEAEKEQEYPLFLQWDKRWGYQEYGDFNIALSGCGPTTLAMAAVALTGDTSVTPDKVAKYSMNNGFYIEGTGTAWKLMTDGCKAFGLKAEEIAIDETVMKAQLDEGKVIICSMRQGDFTSGGHFIMIYDYNKTGFKINDPNCIYRSSRSWKYSEISSQIKILWAFEEG